MSLLLDALKRAEEAKRAKLSSESEPDPLDFAAIKRLADAESTSTSRPESSAAADVGPPDFNLEDYKEVIAPRASSQTSFAKKSVTNDPQRGPELSLENLTDHKTAEKADDQFARAPSVTASPGMQSRLDATRVDAAQSRDTARNAFVAKHSASADKDSKKKWLLPLIAIALLAVGGGGWYVWNEVNRMSRPAAMNIAARPAMTLPAAQPTTGQPGARQPDESASKPGLPAMSVVPPLPPLLPPAAEQTSLPKLAPRMTASTTMRLTEREAMVKSLKDAPVSKEARVELKFARSVEAPAVNSELTDAYEALKNADYPRARTLYAKLVQADTSSADAQLGMATVLARMGELALAARHYRQVLVIDPRNGAALAGLLAVRDSRSPSLEVELKTLVGRNPEAASLRFTLGNLYAVERRWVEAQQAYFEAYRLESENADYLYNLAVSLDHLKQPKLALEYYLKAQAAQPKSGGQFDTAAVSRRVKDLTTDSRNN